MKVLVIEDETSLGGMICEVAESEGFIAKHAATPNEIEAHHTEFQPDIIIMDLLMPDMDGLEVMQYLSHSFSQSQIVIISGSYSESRDLAQRMGTALGLKIIANLGKPLRVPQLRELFADIKKQNPEIARKMA